MPKARLGWTGFPRTISPNGRSTSPDQHRQRPHCNLLLRLSGRAPAPVGAASAVSKSAPWLAFRFGAAQARLPVVVDGFIATSAALAARAFAPDVLDAAIFSHVSHEKHHAKMLKLLGVEPQIALEMRLGEGTGSAIAINLLETAVRLFQEMATFADLQ